MLREFFGKFFNHLKSLLGMDKIVRYTETTLVFLSVLLLTLLVVKIYNRWMKRIAARGQGHELFDQTRFTFTTHLVRSLIYFLGFTLALYTIPALKTLSISLFAGSGIVAVIVGFASQSAFSNIVGGIFLAIFKPFRVGDRIKLVGQNITGFVDDITMRHTVLKTFENSRIIIPNAVISNETIENITLTDPKVCKPVSFSVAYTANLDQAMEVIRQTAEKHPLSIDNRSEEQKLNNEPIVSVRVVALADFSVNLKAWVWANSAGDAFILECELLKMVKENFDKEGIEIPYPYHNVIVKR